MRKMKIKEEGDEDVGKGGEIVGGGGSAKVAVVRGRRWPGWW